MSLRTLSRRALALRPSVAGASRERTFHAAAPVLRGADDFRIKNLMSNFKDPSSPFYIAPGEVGPASPDDHTVSRPLPGQEDAAKDWKAPRFSTGVDRTPAPPHMSQEYDRARATGHEWFDSNGFDPEGRLEWPCAWGESDMYKHINNVSYCRYLESARMRWVLSLVPDLGDVGEFMLSGQHTGFVVKELAVRYRFPVTYPDSLIIASKPHSINQERAEFKIHAAAWSLKENRLVLTSECTCTIYDHEKVRKGVMTDHLRDVLLSRAQA